MLEWYLHAAQERFASARLEHLELWGFYWMHEAIRPAEEASVRAAAEIVHSLGLKLLWIPWFRAPGWDRWRECGFDVAILQPLGHANRPRDLVEEGVLKAVAYEVLARPQTRTQRIRVAVTRHRAWAMLSEIVVEGE